MTRIFVEDKELDLTEELTNAITYSVDDLNSLESKTTAYTKTIIVPGTAKNNEIFGNIFEINQANLTVDTGPNVGYNFNASRTAKARIEVNGLQVIKGVVRLLEIIIDNGIEYEVSIFGELGGFVAKLGNARLQDLDFSIYNHDYNIGNITSAWDNHNSGAGYYYPLIDYGNVSTDKINYQYKAFRPALFLREYIDKIITGAGYTWESAFFNTDFFKRQYITNNQKRLLIPKNQLFFATPTGTYNKTINFGTNTTLYDTLFTNINGGLFTTTDNKEFTYTGTLANFGVNSQFAGQFYKTSGITSLSFCFKWYKNGALYYTDTVRAGGGSANTFVDYLFNYNFNLPLDTSDTFKVVLEVVAVAISTPLLPKSYTVYINTGSVIFNSAILVPSPIELGDNLPMNSILPKNIFQKDLFATTLKLFYLMVKEDKFKEKHLVIEPFIDFYTTTEDWSDKVDRSKPLRIKPMSEINSRYYQMKFKSDSDYFNENYRKKYNEGYGDRVFDNGLEFAKETETVEVIFAATPLTGFDGADKIVPAIYKKTNGIEDSIDHVIRIMQGKKITGVASWNILNNATVLGTYTTYPYAGHLDDPDAPNADLNFGVPKEIFFTLVSGDLSNNLFNTYYSSYLAEITDKDSRLLTVFMKLSEQDIYNLDFGKFKFIDGGKYRLSRIIDYAPGELSKVELLRVIQTEY